MKEEIEVTVQMVRTITGRREEAEVPESAVEDMLCSGWVLDDGEAEEDKPKRGRPRSRD